MCDPILETLLKMQPQPIIVNPVVKMGPIQRLIPIFLLRGGTLGMFCLSPRTKTETGRSKKTMDPARLKTTKDFYC